MKTAHKKHLLDLAGIALIILLYHSLFLYCSHNDVVSNLLARGAGAGIFRASVALLFMALRLFVIILLPACVALRVTAATLFRK